MTLPALEFIDRFLWHVLPPRMQHIRHYEFLAGGRCTRRAAAAAPSLGLQVTGR